MPPLARFAQESQHFVLLRSSAAEGSRASQQHKMLRFLLPLLLACSEARNEFTFFRAEPWRVSRCRIFGHASGIAGGGYGDMTARVAQNPLEQSLRPCRHAKGQKRC